MRYGLHVPNFGPFGDPRALAELAHEAEAAGWDGFFMWDHVLGDPGWREPMVDPWVALAAIAVRTERIRIGPLVTAVPRRRPWKLARETTTLDHLSGGRLVLGVGLGWPPDAEYEHFGEDGSLARLARQLDEGLAILDGLWSGEPYSHAGQEYRVRETVFLPRPVQRPRIPIWVALQSPKAGPLRRAARWDGVFPEKPGGGQLTPAELEVLLTSIRGHRPDAGDFDLVVGGRGVDLAGDELAQLAAVGVAWWLESIPPSKSLATAFDLIAAGPPQAS